MYKLTLIGNSINQYNNINQYNPTKINKNDDNRNNFINKKNMDLEIINFVN
jgi:hypothetical protein